MGRRPRIAIIGAGPAGAIAVDALAQEQCFAAIRVFERREDSGGCWLEDPPGHRQELPNVADLAQRTADKPLKPPSSLPTTTPRSTRYRFSDTSIYPHLETNIAAGPMSFSQEPLPETRSAWSVEQHGQDTPFRHWTVLKDYISGLLDRGDYQNLVSYNTTVELVEKDVQRDVWCLTLRKTMAAQDIDHWWIEEFDAVVVASGHYTVPYIPSIPGLAAFVEAHPDVVTHSKSFRSPSSYADKKVVVVGASISGPDIASSLAAHVRPPLLAVVRGKYHPYFFDYAFQHPHIERKYGISHFDAAGSGTVHFADGSSASAVDHVIFGTGYTWTLPFLPDMEIRNNRVPNLYQHIFWQDDPSLCFVGAVAAGFTFKVFEWQAVAAARFLAGRITLPDKTEMQAWETTRIAQKGDGVPFTALYPAFEEYFEEIRELAGEPTIVDGKAVGRRLPRFEKAWREEFDAGHLRRIEMWKRINAAAVASAAVAATEPKQVLCADERGDSERIGLQKL